MKTQNIKRKNGVNFKIIKKPSILINQNYKEAKNEKVPPLVIKNYLFSPLKGQNVDTSDTNVGSNVMLNS